MVGRIDVVLLNRAARVIPAEWIVALDLASDIAKAGVDPALDGRALQNARVSVIADRLGDCS